VQGFFVFERVKTPVLQASKKKGPNEQQLEGFLLFFFPT